jgi:hypothetical protein
MNKINNKLKINKFKNIELIIFIIIFIYSFCIILFNYYYKIPFYYISLNSTKAIDNINNIMSYDQINTTKNSKHFWNENIDDSIQKNIIDINKEILSILGGSDKFDYIPSMTELYYSSKKNENSDQQYVDNHMDGPFYSCKAYRAIIAINGNKTINTYFPDYNININLKKYDVAIFDYNNEPHYIEVNNNIIDDSQRILLKLHYIEKNNNNLCEDVHCKFGRETRDLFELNKTQLYFSGLGARLSLLYNTNRKYILIFMFGLIVYYYYTSNIIAKFILYLFILIEILGIIYLIHFLMPIYNRFCKKE